MMERNAVRIEEVANHISVEQALEMYKNGYEFPVSGDLMVRCNPTKY